MKKEIHLQFSGCSWNAIPVMCYVAITTAVFVRNFAGTCHRTCTVTQMIAICKMNGRKNKKIGRGKFSRKRFFQINVCYIVDAFISQWREPLLCREYYFLTTENS